MRKTLMLAISTLLLAAACSGDTPRGGPGLSGSVGTAEATTDATGGSDQGDTVVELGPDDVVLTAGLVRFDDCDTLLDYLHEEYSARVGPWGFDRGGWFGPMPIMEPEIAMAADEMAEAAAPAAMAVEDTGAAAPTQSDAPSAAAAPVEGVDFSGTNVQEAGVDEADIVKTDGQRIFTLSAGRLVVVDAASRTRTGAVAVAEGWGRELFIDGDSLLLITRSTSDAPDGSETVLQSIDVSGGTPEIVRTVNVQGNYISARSVGGTARVILRYDPQWNFPFVYPQNDAGASVAEEANRTAVLNSTLDDWLPHYTTGTADSSTGSLMVPCGDVHAPSVFSGFGMTTVVSVPIGGDFDPSSSAAVMAPGDTVYASTGSLYVATTRWVEADTFDDDEAWQEAWHQRRTSIHRFDISGAQAAYESSGEVLGVIHNQFSLSEHDGHLRVVTTVGGPWGDESESWVRVLSTAGDVLVEVGSVGDIGRGEQVQSVRFVGDVGYVVTFRQIDPFYTIDLSDPADPRILGELKIPGFSSYLHPISDSLVLGVGSDADPDGRITGAKVSLFDVSDLTAPREVAVWAAPDGWNDVGWDHRAFLWWAPENLAVIPVTVWNDWSGAVVLRVADGTITEVGRVDHVIEGEEPGRTDCRRLTEADLPTTEMEDFSTELEYMIFDEYGAVLACEPGEAGMTGFECYDEPWFVDEAERLDLILGDESISICWPSDQPDVISRSIVIGDDLWTLGFEGWGGFDGSSKARLHVNDLRTLERLAALEL
ncbi:MAG: beta-propeller domain-containing protein [Acidimicrobiaceae bacterium]|nr:beta-propeller domain-containing protein [Acidimicrobiaceae bacterium]